MTDPSLLVPAFIILALAVLLWQGGSFPIRVRGAARAALILNCVAVSGALIMAFAYGSNVLEFQIYNSMLCAPALIGLVVAIAALCCLARPSVRGVVALLAAAATIIAATLPVPRFDVVPIGVLLVVFGLTPLILLGVRAWSGSVSARPIVVFTGVVLIATCPQVLANGTAPDGDSFLARKDYQSVFLGRSRDYGEQYREAISVTDAYLNTPTVN